ncbi:hypothetical protein HDV00_009425 [Rhizophlyctis rosea]|nr:hypothetical protein HDV00_009425 [Rhizophlyctis rosea]
MLGRGFGMKNVLYAEADEFAELARHWTFFPSAGDQALSAAADAGNLRACQLLTPVHAYPGIVHALPLAAEGHHWETVKYLVSFLKVFHETGWPDSSSNSHVVAYFDVVDKVCRTGNLELLETLQAIRSMDQEHLCRLFAWQSDPKFVEWVGSRAGDPSIMVHEMMEYLEPTDPEDRWKHQLEWLTKQGFVANVGHLCCAIAHDVALFRCFLNPENANDALLAAIGQCSRVGIQLALFEGAQPEEVHFRGAMQMDDDDHRIFRMLLTPENADTALLVAAVLGSKEGIELARAEGADWGRIQYSAAQIANAVGVNEM